jgi:hypothetical protein
MWRGANGCVRVRAAHALSRARTRTPARVPQRRSASLTPRKNDMHRVAHATRAFSARSARSACSAYDVLGPAVEQEALRSAYLRLVRAAHPDAGGSAPTFRLVQEAWERVSTPDARARHDELLRGALTTARPRAEQRQEQRQRQEQHSEQNRRPEEGARTGAQSDWKEAHERAHAKWEAEQPWRVWQKTHAGPLSTVLLLLVLAPAALLPLFHVSDAEDDAPSTALAQLHAATERVTAAHAALLVAARRCARGERRSGSD